MLRFNFLGFPVTIQWTFWLVTALLGGAATKLSRPGGLQEVALWVVIVFASILWHELGHVLFMKKYGAQPEILLYGGGGLAIPHGARFTRRQAFIVAAAGPTFGLLLWALSHRWFYYFPPAPGHRLAHLMESYLWQVNLFWTLINLLPVLPLDGGRMLQALLGPHRLRAVAVIGMIVATLTAVAGFLLLGSLLIAIFFALFAWQNFQTYQQGREAGSVI